MARVFTVVVLLALSATPMAGQTAAKPDFSGTWTLDEPRSASPTFQGFVGPVTVVIEQHEPVLIITTTRGSKTESLMYQLDAAARTGTAPEAPARTSPMFRWFWDGPNIVTESIRNTGAGPEGTYRTKEVRSLARDGSEMIVMMTLIVEHGYDLSNGQNYGTGKDVYRRVPTSK